MVVYVTKWALTKGVLKLEASVGNNGFAKAPGFWEPLHPKDYSTSEAEARLRFNNAKEKKISSLKRQLSKVQAMEFSVKEPPANNQ